MKPVVLAFLSTSLFFASCRPSKPIRDTSSRSPLPTLLDNEVLDKEIHDSVSTRLVLGASPAAKTDVVINFCTNRNIASQAGRKISFGKKLSYNSYGTCVISIPKGHKPGEMELPHWYKFEFAPDESKHIVLLRTKLDDKYGFIQNINQTMEKDPQKSVFVFIHGFNVSFEEAARRAAQLTFDLKFRGAPILFSWPSQESASPLAYTADEASNEVSVPHFEEMLRDVLRKTTAKRVYLLAHSMGNRILIASLKDIAQTEPQLLRGREIFETILAAPDVTADVFRNNIAGILSRAPMGVTLYGSSNDEALKVSKGIHKLNRAGEGGSKMVLMKGVESIDASSVETDFLGHSYFAQSPSVVGDISDLIVQRQRAASRRWLRKAGSKTTPIPYWQFRAN